MCQKQAVGLLVAIDGSVIEVTADTREQIKSVFTALSQKYASVQYTCPKQNEDGTFSSTGTVK